jgi:phenylalanyl-tRNA synthetase alpha chain
MAALVESSQGVEQLILSYVAKNDQINDTYDFSIEQNLDHQGLIGTLKSLLADNYLLDAPLSTSFWTLTSEGEDVVKNGSPEIQVLKAIPEEGISNAALIATLGSELVKLGQGIGMKNKWLQKKGDLIVSVVSNIADETANTLAQVATGTHSVPEEELKNLKKRKLVQQITRKSYKITRGPEFREIRVRKVADLTKAMLTKSEVSSPPPPLYTHSSQL